MKGIFQPTSWHHCCTRCTLKIPNSENKLKINDILSANKDDNIGLVTNGKEDSKSIKFWLCMKSCQLMDWINFKGKAIDERKDYIKLERLCYNCFSERHNLKDCWSKYCHIDYCNKRHHSFIHTDKESNQVATEEIRNDSITCNNIYDRNKQNSFTDLQVLLINVSNHNKTSCKSAVRLESRFHVNF